MNIDNTIVIGENLEVKDSNKLVVGVGGKWQKELNLTDEQYEDLHRIIIQANNQTIIAELRSLREETEEPDYEFDFEKFQPDELEFERGKNWGRAEKQTDIIAKIDQKIVNLEKKL
jgi:hypothetical protein